MNDNLLRDAMIEYAKDYLREQRGIPDTLEGAARSHADFCLHMTGGDAPELRYVQDGEEKPVKRYARWNGEAMGCVICGMLTNNVCNICSGMICALHDESEAHAARDKDVEEGRAI